MALGGLLGGKLALGGVWGLRGGIPKRVGGLLHEGMKPGEQLHEGLAGAS